jgi:hypothetical protein
VVDQEAPSSLSPSGSSRQPQVKVVETSPGRHTLFRSEKLRDKRTTLGAESERPGLGDVEQAQFGPQSPNAGRCRRRRVAYSRRDGAMQPLTPESGKRRAPLGARRRSLTPSRSLNGVRGCSTHRRLGTRAGEYTQRTSLNVHDRNHGRRRQQLECDVRSHGCSSACGGRWPGPGCRGDVEYTISTAGSAQVPVWGHGMVGTPSIRQPDCQELHPGQLRGPGPWDLELPKSRKMGRRRFTTPAPRALLRGERLRVKRTRPGGGLGDVPRANPVWTSISGFSLSCPKEKAGRHKRRKLACSRRYPALRPLTPRSGLLLGRSLGP